MLDIAASELFRGSLSELDHESCPTIAAMRWPGLGLMTQVRFELEPLGRRVETSLFGKAWRTRSNEPALPAVLTCVSVPHVQIERVEVGHPVHGDRALQRRDHLID
jgi:hypothetical protein